MDVQVGSPNSIYLLMLAAVALGASVWAGFARRRAAHRFATANLRRQLLPAGRTTQHWVSAILVCSSLALLAIALMDIRWGKTWRDVPQKGIEVIFVLDVSRSMLAEDVSPNRLHRAKQQIEDIVDEMAGDRVGLVAFAGDARQSVPLTSHYDDFKQTLDGLGPHSVLRGGSRLGDALATAADSFISKTNGHKAIMVLTDGEDQESSPLEVAKKLYADKGIRIFTVGLGDHYQGARIPETASRRGEYVKYQGEQVWSKMNGPLLEQIATATDGAYIPAGTRRVDMAGVYHNYIAHVEQTEFETAKINAYVARYQWFAAPALALLLLEVWWSTRSARREKHATSLQPLKESSTGRKPALPRHAAAWLAVVIALTAAPAQAQPIAAEAATRINAANALLREGKIEDAIEAYRQVPPSASNRDELNYNLAVALFRAGDIEAAQSLFHEVAASRDASLAANSRYNLGNCFYSRAVGTAEQDPAAAIEALHQAISHYRGSLQGNPHNVDARANIELAAQLIHRLQEEPKQNESQQEDSSASENPSQPQDSSSQSDPQAEGDSPDSEESAESEADETSSQDSAEAESMSSEPSPSEPSQEASGSPSEGDPQSGEQAASDDAPSDDAPSDDAPSEDAPSEDAPSEDAPSEDAPSEDAPSEDAPSEDAPSEEDESQPSEVPAGPLTAADEQAADSNASSRNAAMDASADGRLMTREEALKMLQAVRDRDLLRRLRQQQAERRRRVPVDRDW